MTKKNKIFRPKARRAKGFEDRIGARYRAEQTLLAGAAQVFEAHGFEPLTTPAFEYTDVLGKFLPDEERPNAGVFSVEDDDKQWLSLRYDLTAPLARFVAENYDGLPKPFRRFAFGPVWRNEKPGPGRYREFLQCDADTVGAAGPAADAEMIILASKIMQSAKLTAGEYVVRVNDRRLLDAVMTDIGTPDTAVGKAQTATVLRAIDKLDRLGETGISYLLGAGRKDESGDYTKGAGLDAAGIAKVLAFTRAGQGDRADTFVALEKLLGGNGLARDALAQMQVIDGLVTAAGLDEQTVLFDPSIVRGLGYYTGCVFETDVTLETLNEKGQLIRFGSVGSGGRYDGLVARFKGVEVPATGFSFGVSRFAALLHSLGRLGADVPAPVVVLALEPEQMAAYFAMADELRAAGIRAEVYMGNSGMRAQMKYADKRGAPAVVIVGEDERATGQITVKDLNLGAKLSEQITDNTQWREGRPAQHTGPRGELVQLVQRVLVD
ncbi:MAG: histidine--tRNA ligase [Robiginitomaculum sp.]|nr:histidine--tRNA ligase [Robiginitomaculum sp.]